MSVCCQISGQIRGFLRQSALSQLATCGVIAETNVRSDSYESFDLTLSCLHISSQLLATYRNG